MASKNAPDITGQIEIREAADRVVDSVLLKSTDQIPDAEQVREIRAAVEQQINELIFSVRDYVSHISQQSLPPTYSPGQLAKNLGITVDKVLNWIRNGQIDAIDVSADRSGRPGIASTPTRSRSSKRFEIRLHPRNRFVARNETMKKSSSSFKSSFKRRQRLS